MTKKNICAYLLEEEERILELKAQLITKLFELDVELDVIRKQSARHVCEDLSPEGRMRTRKLAEEVEEELKG